MSELVTSSGSAQRQHAVLRAVCKAAGSSDLHCQLPLIGSSTWKLLNHASSHGPHILRMLIYRGQSLIQSALSEEIVWNYGRLQASECTTLRYALSHNALFTVLMRSLLGLAPLQQEPSYHATLNLIAKAQDYTNIPPSNLNTFCTSTSRTNPLGDLFVVLVGALVIGHGEDATSRWVRGALGRFILIATETLDSLQAPCARGPTAKRKALEEGEDKPGPNGSYLHQPKRQLLVIEGARMLLHGDMRDYVAGETYPCVENAELLQRIVDMLEVNAQELRMECGRLMHSIESYDV